MMRKEIKREERLEESQKRGKEVPMKTTTFFLKNK